jgi:hypothetical protein
LAKLFDGILTPRSTDCSQQEEKDPLLAVRVAPQANKKLQQIHQRNDVVLSEYSACSGSKSLTVISR